MEKVNVLFFWASLGGLIAFLYGPWQAFWANWFIQEAFSVRDKLFDMGLRHEVEFTDEAYRTNRVAINDFIRNANRYTWTQLLFLLIPQNVSGSSLSVASLNEGALDSSVYDPIIKQVIKALIISIIMRAPALWPLVIGVLVLRLWQISASGMAEATTSIFTTKAVRLGQNVTRASGLLAH